MNIDRRRAMSLGLGATVVVLASASSANAADQTATLQAQINAAQAPGGTGTLTLTTGTYDVTGLTASASYPLIISGVPGRTILRSLNGNTRILYIAPSPQTATSTVPNVVVSGIVFDGNSAATPNTPSFENTYLLHAAQCMDILVEKCVFKGTRTSGAGFDACTGRVVGNQFFNIGQIAIKTGRFSGAYQQATVGSQALTLNGMEISGNHIHEVYNGGIYVSHWVSSNEEDSTIISNNHVEGVLSGSGNGPYGNGIYVLGSNNVVVANNRVSNCVYGGIRVTSSKFCQVTGNIVSRIADAAIFVEFTFDSAVVSNNVVEDVNIGIQLTGGGGSMGSTGVCSNNIVRNVSRVATNPQVSNFIGIGVVAMATNCVGNVVEGVAANSHGPGVGILMMDWSSGTTSHHHQVEANMVKGAGCGIGLVLGSVDNHFSHRTTETIETNAM
jgi:uncharacterized secreted repeat protein (TIGR03808 family)